MAIAGLDRTPFVRRCDRLSKTWGDLSKGVPNERYMAGSKKLVVETMRQGPLFEEPEADRPHLPFFPKCYDVLLAVTGRLLIRCVGGPNKKPANKKSSPKEDLTERKLSGQQGEKKCSTKRPPQMRRPERSGYSRLLRVVQTS